MINNSIAFKNNISQEVLDFFDPYTIDNLSASKHNSESQFLKRLTKYLCLTISESLPSDTKIKDTYFKSITNLSDKPYTEYKKIKAREDAKFIYLMKLKYAIKQILTYKYDSNISAILFFINSKISSQKTQTTTKINESIKNYFSELFRSSNKMNEMTKKELVERLFNAIAIQDYENENVVNEPYLEISDDNNISTEYYQHILVDLTDKQIINLAEKKFQDYLYDFTHTIEKGKKV